MSEQVPPIFVKALTFATQKHHHQRRLDPYQSPYINHPIQLVDVLAQVGGVHDTTILCAALLHDVIEDTDTTYEDVRAQFNQQIADLVQEMTDDKRLKKAERKQRQIEQAPHKSLAAKHIGLADKICNIRDLCLHPPTSWSEQRQREYFQWAYQVVAGLRGTNAAMEELFDQLYEQGMEKLGTPNARG